MAQRACACDEPQDMCAWDSVRVCHALRCACALCLSALCAPYASVRMCFVPHPVYSVLCVYSASVRARSMSTSRCVSCASARECHVLRFPSCLVSSAHVLCASVRVCHVPQCACAMNQWAGGVCLGVRATRCTCAQFLMDVCHVPPCPCQVRLSARVLGVTVRVCPAPIAHVARSMRACSVPQYACTMCLSERMSCASVRVCRV